MSVQVVGAKVVTNAKSPGARCYGFVTMSSTDEATKCISHLHRTELHGRMISVERVSEATQYEMQRLSKGIGPLFHVSEMEHKMKGMCEEDSSNCA